MVNGCRVSGVGYRVSNRYPNPEPRNPEPETRANHDPNRPSQQTPWRRRISGDAVQIESLARRRWTAPQHPRVAQAPDLRHRRGRGDGGALFALATRTSG